MALKVALVHDHLTQMGGAEKVLQVLARMYPEAPIFTLLYDKKRLGNIFPKERIKTSFLQNMPLALAHPQWYLPLMPLATELYPLSGYDLVISSTSAMAKGAITGPETLHICYCHTPTRYLWSETHEYIKSLKRHRLTKYLAYPFLPGLRLWDAAASARPEVMVANSATVAERIAKYYRRASTVIFPPVETTQFTPQTAPVNGPGAYFLAGGRLVAYKRFDLTIQAFNRTDQRLKIFGDGPEFVTLRALARPNIEFVGAVSEAEKAQLFAGALAFINPQVEDFGITVVESLAAGRPVIAFAAGGATETVVEGQTGLFFREQTPEALVEVLGRFRSEDFDPAKLKQAAENFSVAQFEARFRALVAKEYASFNRRPAPPSAS